MTAPRYSDFGVTVHAGDCLDLLAELPDASVHAVVTDPPYGLRFMGAAWDGADIEAGVALRRSQAPMPDDGKAGENGGYRSAAAEPGRYDLSANAAFGEWCQLWATECLRVLKPGGHLLAFGGSRTWHRLTAAVEDAGFEIRDSIAWLYASGFPKSMNVSKAIDNARDDRADIIRVTGFVRDARKTSGRTIAEIDAAFGANGMAWRWSTTKESPVVPRWEQWLQLKDLLGFGNEMDAEVWRLNGRKGTPGHERPDREVGPKGGHIFGEGRTLHNAGTPVLPAAEVWQGWGTALKPAFEPIVVGRKPIVGTVAANVLKHDTGALNIDGCRIAAGQDYRDKCASVVGLDSNRNGDAYGEWTGTRADSAHEAGRWPTNVVVTHASTPDGMDLCVDGCVEGCPVGELGDAARFFPAFRFEAKAPAGERPRVDGVAHPTVKPLALMRWLVRLVTPPGGVVLDPFLGSGTTAQAARAEGFECIGIERDESYLPLIKARLGGTTPDLFGGAA